MGEEGGNRLSDRVTIGDCTLIHGDCLVVMAGMEDASIDMIFTDPPYGHNNNNGDLIANWEAALGGEKKAESEWRPIANDGPEANELVRAAMDEWNRLIAPGCCCCCCGGGGGPDPQFARWSLWLDEAIGFKQMVVWDKGPMGMGWHYRRSYETVLVGEKPGAACRWFAETPTIENILRPGWRGISKIIPQADDHPTPKPPELASHFIGLHTKPRDIVLDSFMGRASTAVACLRSGRRFVGIEIDDIHFSRAVDRVRREAAQGRLL